MSKSDTFVRVLHDVGGAAWFGGSLMGAVGLNGASQSVSDPAERIKVATAGWARWTPFNAAAIGAHLVGGLGLLIANRDRARAQSGVTANTVVKAALTLAAVGTTAYSGVLGARLGDTHRVPADGGTVPSDQTPDDISSAQQQLRALQWATPVLMGVVVALGAQQGEQQRPQNVVRGLAGKVTR